MMRMPNECLLAHSTAATVTMPYSRGFVRLMAAASGTTCEVQLNTRARPTQPKPEPKRRRVTSTVAAALRLTHGEQPPAAALRQPCLVAGRREVIEGSLGWLH
jgi:hypothetical protein